MILRGSAGRVCHLENVKSYMSYLQQYTKIIKMLTGMKYTNNKNNISEMLKVYIINSRTKSYILNIKI
jgi:hypothetical protein